MRVFVQALHLELDCKIVISQLIQQPGLLRVKDFTTVSFFRHFPPIL